MDEAVKNRNAPIFFVVFQPSLAILCPFRKVQCWWTTLSLLRWRAAYNDYDYPLGRSNFQHLWHNRPSQKKGGSRRKRSVKKNTTINSRISTRSKVKEWRGGGTAPPQQSPSETEWNSEIASKYGRSQSASSDETFLFQSHCAVRRRLEPADEK